MATADDLDFLAMVTELVGEFERTATWSSISNDASDYSPSTGAATRTVTTHTLDVSPAIAFDPSSLRASSQFQSGSTMQQGEIGIVFAAQGLTFTPKQGDLCEIDGETWQCVGVSAMPASAPVYAWAARLIR